MVFVPFAHGVQYARSLGFSLQWASGVISSVGIGGLVGRIVTGPLSDRIDRRRAVALALAIETLSFVGIAVADNLVLLYASAIAFGLSYGGSVAVFPALVADYFGRTHAGAIVGRFFATAGFVRRDRAVRGAAAAECHGGLWLDVLDGGGCQRLCAGPGIHAAPARAAAQALNRSVAAAPRAGQMLSALASPAAIRADG